MTAATSPLVLGGLGLLGLLCTEASRRRRGSSGKRGAPRSISAFRQPEVELPKRERGGPFKPTQAWRAEAGAMPLARKRQPRRAYRGAKPLTDEYPGHSALEEGAWSAAARLLGDSRTDQEAYKKARTAIERARGKRNTDVATRVYWLMRHPFVSE